MRDIVREIQDCGINAASVVFCAARDAFRDALYGPVTDVTSRLDVRPTEGDTGHKRQAYSCHTYWTCLTSMFSNLHLNTCRGLQTLLVILSTQQEVTSMVEFLPLVWKLF